MIDPKRFRQVDDLFDGALQLPEEAREAFLREACRGDEALLDEVRSLLASVTSSESRLGENVAEFAPPLISSLTGPGEAEEPPLPPGEMLGAWRIVREVGRGGMGEVYLAERADDAFHLQAAVKVVKRGMDTAEVLRRFHAERRILASLDHPNIARVLDGGATADGRPYLVLEYVEGEPIHRWCDARRLELRERVTLFRKVCEAVDQAHRRLIVHRDVKPSNVLVGEDGEPKLLDFGIAKLLEGDGEATITGARLLTPLFAAPEQEAGLPVTTATDVYSLGRLLQLLLSGVTPGRPAEDPGAIAAARGTTPEELRRQLRGDLDTIVLRAMAADPERRYASALQLSEDLGRWMEGRPVLARPDSLGYRAGKFVRRNRGAVTAGLVSVLLVLTSLLALAMAQHRTAEALTQAERERDAAEEVVELLQGIFRAGDPMTTRPERLDTLRARDLLDRSALRLQGDLADRPDLRARLARTLGDTYRGMGLLEPADSLLREAVELHRTLGDPLGLSRALNSLSGIELQRGGGSGAVALLREAVALPTGDPDHLLRVRSNLASALQRAGEFQEAAALYEAVEAEILAAPVPDSTLLSSVLGARGALAHNTGDFAASASLLERALELDRGRLGADHWRVGLAHVNLAFARQRDGLLDEADARYGEGVAILTAALGTDHNLRLNALGAWANVRSQRGRLEEAEVLYREAIQGIRRAEGPSPGLAIDLSNYAGHLEKMGDPTGAESALREGLEIQLGVLGPDHPNSGVQRQILARFLCRQDRREEGVQEFTEALAVLERAFPPDHFRVTEAREGLEGCGGEEGAGG
jgi:eukaryotic-like serine/threonine-protein kinase